MWIKICANTSLRDALAAVELGADAVGFVFAPSKRQVTPAQVREIVAGLPDGPERIGVFPRATAEQIASAATHARLTGMQLHGGFDPGVTNRLRELLPGVTLIEVAHWTIGADAASEGAVLRDLTRVQQNAPAGDAPRVLIDSKLGAEAGGTGVHFDWEAARPLFCSAMGPRLILAGGLRPENVEEAIRVLQPWGVDVASGVESSPGKKDPDRLKSFVRAARAQQTPSGR